MFFILPCFYHVENAQNLSPNELHCIFSRLYSVFPHSRVPNAIGTIQDEFQKLEAEILEYDSLYGSISKGLGTTKFMNLIG